MAFVKPLRRSSSPPIPSYEQATSVSNPLLGAQSSPAGSSRTGYHQPSVQSIRSSEDSLCTPRQSTESSPTSLDSDTNSDIYEGLRREVDDLDYEGEDYELEELENGSLRRRRRRNSESRWKGTYYELRRRVDRWRKTWTWKWPHWSSTGLVRWQCPDIPETWRPGASVIARVVGLIALIALGYALFIFAILPNARNGLAQMFDPEGVKQFAQGSVDAERLQGYLKHVTSFDHVAGSKGSFYLAEWMKDLFWKAGMDQVKLDEYQVYLNYAKEGGRRVAIIEPPELRWEAKLEEEAAYPDPSKMNTLVFHGHSRAGNVSGPLIYFNYGSKADYKSVCLDSGIDCRGAIGIVKYYGTQGDRALKVKAAEEWGIKGVLIYSDPKDDGFLKGEVWPNGRWRPSDGVQRGAVSLMSWIVGDVLTPGWASTADAKRISKDNNPGLVNIPSLPLAWRDAQKLLQSLKGHGQRLPPEWYGGVPDVEWWSGDLTSPTVLLQNEQDENEKQKIFNVMGTIEGLESNPKSIVVGNHRDSWCFGAGDPGSGTAVMLEVIAILGQLRAQGWRPLRSIVFASWDAEEYNMIGSTEYVEDHIDELRSNGVAYLNVDVGVVGPNFRASASPILQKALFHVLDRVEDPIQNKTLRKLWQEKGTRLEGLGSGSDYVAFQDLAGVSSLDFGFQGDGFPYHSCYETYEWMEKFGDPGLLYHQALAQVWVLLVLELSGEWLLPFGLTDYAQSVGDYITNLESYAARMGAPWANDKGEGGFDLKSLFNASHTFKKAAKKSNEWEDQWTGEVYAHGAVETNALAYDRILHNNKVSSFETYLLDIPRPGNDQGPFGVPGREQFKHVIFGPQLWSGYDEGYFPFIRDAIDKGNWTAAQLQVEKTARILNNACENLV